MEVVNTVEDFVERIKNKKSVSRFVISLGFKWDLKNSKVLRSADLRSADLSNNKKILKKRIVILENVKQSEPNGNLKLDV